MNRHTFETFHSNAKSVFPDYRLVILCELTLFWYLLLKWVALFKKQLKIHRFSVDVCTTHLTRPRPSNQLLFSSLVHNEIGSTIFEFCQLNQ